MVWLSESVEVLIGEGLQGAAAPKVHDVVVVGSGYGGAVSALRLAQQGLEVLVLERGKEYLSGDFPNDLGVAFGRFRVERNDAGNVDGYEEGLYDLRIGDKFGALVGNGLGGTSLINAGVVIAPDPRVFDKQRAGAPAWPVALRPTRPGRYPVSLRAAFRRARRMLKAEVFRETFAFKENLTSGAHAKPLVPHKTLRMQELGRAIAARAGSDVTVSSGPLRIAVDLNGPIAPGGGLPKTELCSACGDCVSGCNFNAKKTLPYTYLPAAYEAGARMFVGASVLSVRKDGPVWVVRYMRTESRKAQRDGTPVPTYELRARHVILSAGTFGSTEILARSAKDHGLPLSSALGAHMSTNGDALGFGYMMDKPVNGVGVGSQEFIPQGYAVGPTITHGVRIRHRSDVTQSLMIQDGAVPGALAGVFHELVTSTAALAQLDHWTFRDMPQPGGSSRDAEDWAVLRPTGLTHTQTLLAMGHDPSAGSARLDEKTDRLRLAYDTGRMAQLENLQDSYLERVQDVKGIHLRNPVLRPLPPGVANVLSGPKLSNGTFTVHPLGGCVMGDDSARGVVDHLGRVFASSAGTQVHEGLYVLDGAIVPTSLGANPLLTITALAERAMETLAPGIAASLGKQVPSRQLPVRFANINQVANPYAREVDVNFTEALRARASAFKWMQEGKEVARAAHLILHLPVDNLELFGSDSQHVCPIPNQLGRGTGDKERLGARLRIDPPRGGDNKESIELMVEAGWVSILPVPQTSWPRAIDAWIRTALTWFILRGHEEIGRGLLRLFRLVPKEPDQEAASPWRRFIGFLKMCGHASETRGMEYRLILRDTQPRGNAVQRYTLIGTKDVGYAASWRAIGRFLGEGGRRPLARANVWKAFGELHAVIRNEAGDAVGGGVLSMDMLDMTRMHAPQLAMQRDTPNALLGLAGYPLWFARLLVKTRLWDFRLPDYPLHMPRELTGKDKEPVPTADREWDTPWPPTFPHLRIFDASGNLQKVAPQAPVSIWVQRHEGSTVRDVELKLTRYRQAHAARAPARGGMTQFKTLIMLNGFAQSTLGFVPQEHVRRWQADNDEPGLAEFFYEQGFDVWLFDYRTSSILDASKLRCRMDETAQFDIPAAVDHVIGQLAGETGMSADAIQIFAFAHCVGAASLAMSMLGGYLRHPAPSPDRPGPSKLAGVTFSQMQMFLVGSTTAQMRLQVAGVLRDVFGLDYLRLSAAERQPTQLESVLDRLFATLPDDPGEECPHERDLALPRPGICTCKRMSGTISRLLKHDRIKEETHDKLPVYFGRANTGLLVHGGRCVENERLVNADGQNVYVTDENIARYLDVPVAILHGRHNALFNVESAQRTIEQIRRVNKNMGRDKVYRCIIAETHAHFDCTIGYRPEMREEILKPLRDFYDAAWSWHGAPPELAGPSLARWTYPKAPLAGPLLGWTRTDGAKRIVRLWIEVDDTEADRAIGVVTRCRMGPATVSTQLWSVIRVPLDAVGDPKQLNPVAVGSHDPYVAIAVADLEFDLARAWEDVSVEAFSIHELEVEPTAASKTGAPAAPKEPGGGPVSSLPPAMTPGEFQRALGGGYVPRRDPIRLQSVAGATLPPAVTSDEFQRAQRDGLVPKHNFPLFTEVAGPSADFLAAFAGAQSPQQVQQVQQVQPVSNYPTEQAATHVRTLRDELARRRGIALRADPGTLSRRERRVPRGLGIETLARIRADVIRGPQGDGLSFLAGSCRHPGLAFEDRRSEASLERAHAAVARSSVPPAFMLMVGDQIYADATGGVIDSPSTIEKIALRHRRAFNTSAFFQLTSSLPTYMAIDDHELSDGWSAEDLLRPGGTRFFRTARASYAAYQWAHAPRNVDAPGFNYSFEENGIGFFVLDTRTKRRRYTRLSRVCTSRQLDALKAWLAAQPGDARPKFVVSGSVFAPGLEAGRSPGAGLAQRGIDTWQLAPHQRAELLDFIASRQIRGVVFLSGDYHCAATAVLEYSSGLRSYAITVPPFYAAIPAANVQPLDIMLQEKVPLPSGVTVDIEGRPMPGNGFADVRVFPTAAGWQVEVGFQVNLFEEKSGHPLRVPVNFTLS
jgi:choline dehydrogenase-like flavoprotein